LNQSVAENAPHPGWSQILEAMPIAQIPSLVLLNLDVGAISFIEVGMNLLDQVSHRFLAALREI